MHALQTYTDLKKRKDRSKEGGMEGGKEKRKGGRKQRWQKGEDIVECKVLVSPVLKTKSYTFV